jgi:glycosyltransferase involved in cell wall biosynthesis
MVDRVVKGMSQKILGWPGTGALSFLRRGSQAAIACRVFILRLRERLEFDSPVLMAIGACFALLGGFVYYKRNKAKKAFIIWSRIHAAAFSDYVSDIVSKLMRSATATVGQAQKGHPFRSMFRDHVEGLSATPQTQRFFDDPRSLLGPIAIVLKSNTGDEKGVISILYSYACPLFAKLFDIQRIAEKYYLVLEPSWSGYCNLDILCYSQMQCPVFVQAYEPRDEEFIRGLSSNLVAVPVSNNWWVDHRIFRPLPNVRKDVDVIMVAGWAYFKRHHQFFRAVMKLRKAGIVLKVVLVGYPMGQNRNDIFDLAAFYGIQDQLELYESIPAEEVNYHLNRAKVNVIWSRREGVNRAVIEGLFAGVPCILREGFNYGHHYAYVNDLTGCYSNDRELPSKLLSMVNDYQRFQRFRPRDWVSEHMSPQKGCEILAEAIRQVALRHGEKWTKTLAIKVNGLKGMQYWDVDDQRRFASDYNFLVSCIR